MISWIVIMLLFWHCQKPSQLDPGVKISYNILTPSRNFHPQQINDIYRVSSGQGKVMEIPDLAKVREKSGNFVEGQG